MTETPKHTDDLEAAVSFSGFGLAPLKIEGEPVPGWEARPRRSPPWIARKTEWPRRKIARALERLADWICRDRDEGW